MDDIYSRLCKTLKETFSFKDRNGSSFFLVPDIFLNRRTNKDYKKIDKYYNSNYTA